MVHPFAVGHASILPAVQSDYYPHARFFLVLSIAYGEVVGMVVSGLCTGLFGFIVVVSLMTGQLVVARGRVRRGGAL